LRYVDTSVVVSLYVTEPRSSRATAEVAKNPADLVVSPWVTLELKSALALTVRQGKLTPQAAGQVLNDYALDCAQGKYIEIGIRTDHFLLGQRSLTFDNGLRAGDALHLGIAQLEGLTLVSADGNLCRVASALGVPTVHLP
jgi:predicted nucleic acid-binding protein